VLARNRQRLVAGTAQVVVQGAAEPAFACGASLSPWGTHLSSEEYEPNAFTAAGDPQFKAFSKNLYGSETAANPYNYGHMPEVTVNPDGTASIRKHYCIGRISHELVQVMPANRTVLMGDDATNSGYFVFVADKEKDLSSGTLYVAKPPSSRPTATPAWSAPRWASPRWKARR
jgi:secreted PhoX family phosphatase